MKMGFKRGKGHAMPKVSVRWRERKIKIKRGEKVTEETARERARGNGATELGDMEAEAQNEG